jgi:cholesterol transport system auxiliary component
MKQGELFLPALGLSLALTGCGPTATSYDLSAATPRLGATRGTLAIEAVRAEPPLDGALIVIRTPDGLQRLSGAQWADSLPRLAQSRIRETLQNAGQTASLHAVGGPARRLLVDIRRFDIDVGRREARVEFFAQIAGGAGRLFAEAEPVGVIGGAEPAQALDRAFSRALADLARWTAGVR